MLLDTSLTIGYKCVKCGSFEFISVALFNLTYKKTLYVSCSCKKSGVNIIRRNQEIYEVRVPCIACEEDHLYNFSKKDILMKNLNVYYCRETNIKTCFIGDDTEVRQSVDLLEKEQDEIMDNCGYENYFKNTQVMFSVLNRVHDLAENGDLFCKCSESEFELTLYADKIYLKCLKCKGEAIVNAFSNEDLKSILNKNQIILL